MLFTLLLVAALADAPAGAPAPLASTLSEAVELERAGRFEEALATCQRLSAEDPNDHQVRLAIARLHMRMGHPQFAEPVYASLMLEDAGNLDALLGLADARVAQWRFQDALDALERAEQIAPEDPAVLATLGRTHQEVGRSRLAVAYLERAASLSSAPQYRLSLERARAAHQHRIEVHSFGEQFTGDAPASRSGDFRLNARLNDVVRVIGRGQVHRKFDADDARGGAGMEWRVTPYTTFIAQALVGPGNRVLPTGDFLGEIDYMAGRASVSGGVRHFEFNGARVTAVTPGVTWWASNRVSFGVRYSLAVTDAPTLTSTSKGHTTQVRSSFQVHPRVWLNAGYARGVEDFDNFSFDRIGAFRANTGSGGVRVDLPWLTSLTGSYEHQVRQDETKVQRLTFSFAQRF